MHECPWVGGTEVASSWSTLVRLHLNDRSWLTGDNYLCRDILYELACVGNLPLPQQSHPSRKRQRGSDDLLPSNMGGNRGPTLTVPSDQARTIAGNRRVSSRELSTSQARTAATPHTDVSSLPLQQQYPLPSNVHEVGRLPIYGQTQFAPRPSDSFETTSDQWLAASQGMPAMPSHLYGEGSSQQPVSMAPASNAVPLIDDMFFEQLSSGLPYPYMNQYASGGMSSINFTHGKQ